MPLTFQALWLLCGLGTATFASVAVVHATGALRILPWLAIALGFAAGAWTQHATGSIDASWVGGLSAAAAALELIRPGHYLVTGGAAGALAALWAGLMQSQGVPAAAAGPAAAAITLLSAVASSRHATFAPLRVREEALLGLSALALIIGTTPAIVQGWQSATALNVTGPAASTAFLPGWMMAFIAGSMILGGLWSWWRRG